MPRILSNFYEIMPFKRLLLPCGPLNMISSMHWAMNFPDVGPKLFCSDGSMKEKGTTNLHTGTYSK